MGFPFIPGLGDLPGLLTNNVLVLVPLQDPPMAGPPFRPSQSHLPVVVIPPEKVIRCLSPD